MTPIIKNGEVVVINRMAYLFSSPQREDIVVVVPRELPEKIVKRVIALPGISTEAQPRYTETVSTSTPALSETSTPESAPVVVAPALEVVSTSTPEVVAGAETSATSTEVTMTPPNLPFRPRLSLGSEGGGSVF